MDENKEPKGFSQAKNQAQKIINNTSKLKTLLNKAINKLKSANHKRLNEYKEDLAALIRMVNAWKSGEFTTVPWKSILFAVAAIFYFVNPFDFIFDYIPFFGFLDDIAVIGFVLNSIREDITNFKEWEKSK